MNCAQTRNLLHAFMDRELDLVRHLEIEHHLADCTACAEEHDHLRALHTALGNDALYFRAPAELADRVRASLRRADNPEPVLPPPRRVRWRRFAVVTAAAAAVALLVWAVGFSSLFRSSPAADERLTEQVVASHVRSLQEKHLTDILSEDKHEVGPWFQRKVDFAPTVMDLKAQGFPLVGGRLDYLDNRPVAALVYHRHKHDINLFVWPAAAGVERGPTTTTRQGYHVIHWVAGDMNWWAVSNLNTEELHEFVRLIQGQGGLPR